MFLWLFGSIFKAFNYFGIGKWRNIAKTPTRWMQCSGNLAQYLAWVQNPTTLQQEQEIEIWKKDPDTNAALSQVEVPISYLERYSPKGSCHPVESDMGHTLAQTCSYRIMIWNASGVPKNSPVNPGQRGWKEIENSRSASGKPMVSGADPSLARSRENPNFTSNDCKNDMPVLGFASSGLSRLPCWTS